jgi:hypothetical protein
LPDGRLLPACRIEEYRHPPRPILGTFARCPRLSRRSSRVGFRIVPSLRPLGILDIQHLQLGRQRLLGRVDGDDADLDAIGEGRVDALKCDPSASIVAVPGRERRALAPELEPKA